MAEVTMIMQHFSHYMSYYYIMSCYYIMSGINKALNVISYYIITLCANPLLWYASVILLHYEPIFTLWTFITLKLLQYEPLLHYQLLHPSTPPRRQKWNCTSWSDADQIFNDIVVFIVWPCLGPGSQISGSSYENFLCNLLCISIF